MNKMIFIDDDVLFLDLLNHFFGCTEHQYVFNAHHLEMILKTKGPFDVLITDYDMPDKNGLSLAQWTHDLYPNLPIMVLSAHAKPLILPDFIKKWILKPINFDLLNYEILEVIERYGAVEKT